MKTKIIIVLLASFLLIGGCEIVELIESPRRQRIQLDSLYATSVDTTVVDTTKYPINFDVNVNGWEDIEINF